MGLANTVSALLNQVMAARSKRGPYRYAVKNWSQIDDLELAERVLATEFFHGTVEPLSLPIEKFKSLLVLAPHQDDETIGAGGTLLLAGAAGANIQVLHITDGVQSAPPYAESSAAAADIRNGEASTVCSKLGAAMHQLGLSNLRPEPTIEHIDRLAELIHDLRPEVLLLPWLLDSPAKHRMTHHLLWLANYRRRLPDCEVWGYQVHNTLFPNGFVDITAVTEEKRSLLECFRSQNENYYRLDHIAMGLAAWNSRIVRSATKRYLELFSVSPLSESLRLVDHFYFRNLRATYRGNTQIMTAVASVHHAVTGKRL